jgi:hypothetical protein
MALNNQIGSPAMKLSDHARNNYRIIMSCMDDPQNCFWHGVAASPMLSALSVVGGLLVLSVLIVWGNRAEIEELETTSPTKMTVKAAGHSAGK